jgi:hypothetical protein
MIRCRHLCEQTYSGKGGKTQDQEGRFVYTSNRGAKLSKYDTTMPLIVEGPSDRCCHCGMSGNVIFSLAEVLESTDALFL